MLTPSFLRTRDFVLLLQSFVRPLQSLNDNFVDFVNEHRIESRMTSQVLWFEWYLTHKFNKYFIDSTDTIIIEDAVDIGVPVYRTADPNQVPYTVWYINDDWSALKGTKEEPPLFYYRAENIDINETSFTVKVPPINIAESDFVPMLYAVVNTYKIAGKTFRIKITKTT